MPCSPPHRHWSGGFALPEDEKYLGLRIHHESGAFTIIPVNITVGAAGSVLVTLKSEKWVQHVAWRAVRWGAHE